MKPSETLFGEHIAYEIHRQFPLEYIRVFVRESDSDGLQVVRLDLRTHYGREVSADISMYTPENMYICAKEMARLTSMLLLAPE